MLFQNQIFAIVLLDICGFNLFTVHDQILLLSHYVFFLTVSQEGA